MLFIALFEIHSAHLYAAFHPQGYSVVPLPVQGQARTELCTQPQCSLWPTSGDPGPPDSLCGSTLSPPPVVAQPVAGLKGSQRPPLGGGGLQRQAAGNSAAPARVSVWPPCLDHSPFPGFSVPAGWALAGHIPSDGGAPGVPLTERQAGRQREAFPMKAWLQQGEGNSVDQKKHLHFLCSCLHWQESLVAWSAAQLRQEHRGSGADPREQRSERRQGRGVFV